MEIKNIFVKLYIPLKEAVLNGYLQAGDYNHPLTDKILNSLTLKEKELLLKWCGFYRDHMPSNERLHVLKPCDDLIIAAVKAEYNKSVQDQKR